MSPLCSARSMNKAAQRQIRPPVGGCRRPQKGTSYDFVIGCELSIRTASFVRTVRNMISFGTDDKARKVNEYRANSVVTVRRPEWPPYRNGRDRTGQGSAMSHWV
jgi:hypothetical protein